MFVMQISVEGSYSNWLNCRHYCNCCVIFFEFATELWCKGTLLTVL